jgi:hypothetical protein
LEGGRHSPGIAASAVAAIMVKNPRQATSIRNNRTINISGSKNLGEPGAMQVGRMAVFGQGDSCAGRLAMER